MNLRFLRRFAATLPKSWQSELRRIHFRRRIHRGSFISDEPEFSKLSGMITEGDWTIDVGANVGFYTKRLAELVGPGGRVLAFEPVPETFVLLATNIGNCGLSNVTLFNAALSDSTNVVTMRVPVYESTGLKNFYQAHLSGEGDLRVLTLRLDSLHIANPVRLVKIDAEGHELSVLKGMRNTLARDHPILIVEAPCDEAWEMLRSLDYTGIQLRSSPNVIFQRSDAPREDLGRCGV